jgi:hypothetical protein
LEHVKTLKLLTLKAFAIYSVASKRRKELQKNIQMFRFISLARRTLMALKINISLQRDKETMNH